VQLNAILDFASWPGGTYSNTWTGPPVTSVDVYGSVSAIDVFNYGFNAVTDLTLSSSTPSSTTLSDKSPSSTKMDPPSLMSSGMSSINALGASSARPTGAIIGGSVGAVLALAGVALSTYLCHRCRWRRLFNLAQRTNRSSGFHAVGKYSLENLRRTVSAGSDAEIAYKTNRDLDRPETGQSLVVLPRGLDNNSVGTTDQHQMIMLRHTGVDSAWSEEVARKLETWMTTAEYSGRSERSVSGRSPSGFNGEREIFEGTSLSHDIWRSLTD